MRLLIAGGGTGGHLFPGIAVAEEFLAREPGNEVLFVGTERGIEARLLPRLGYRLERIAATGLKGMGGLSQVKGAFLGLYAYAQSRRILKSFRPDLVLGVGGYASGPVVLAARGMLIPRFIHEQNAIPGLTNRILARVADRVFISLAEAGKFFPKEKTVLTGNPVRREILAEASIAGESPPLAPPLTKGGNGGGFDKGGSPPGRGDFRLLVFGGSAGAHSINMAMLAALPHLSGVRERLAITHQTGEKDLSEVRAGYEKAGFRAEVLPFIDGMAAAYRNADLVLCRAGATTIAEVTACGKACIFIPYPFAADDHQRRNAEALADREAGFMLLERELSGERLAGMITELMGERERLLAAGRNARSLARPDAAKAIVDEMIKM